jgi:hypothetical protein
MISGSPEEGESLTAMIVREAMEEAGLKTENPMPFGSSSTRRWKRSSIRMEIDASSSRSCTPATSSRASRALPTTRQWTCSGSIRRGFRITACCRSALCSLLSVGGNRPVSFRWQRDHAQADPGGARCCFRRKQIPTIDP